MGEPASTLDTLLRRAAARDPNAIALVAPGRVGLDFAGLIDQVTAVRVALAASGLGPADRVAIALPQGPEMAVAVLSVASARPCVPLNPSLRAEEMTRYLAEVGARAVIVPRAGDHPARAAAHAAGLRVLTVHASPGAPAGRFLLSDGASGHAPARAGDQAGDSAAPRAEDLALVLPTSGTTSRPKRVPLSHGNLCASARSIAATLALGAGDRALIVMPLFHIHGLQMWLATLGSGGSAACPPEFDPARFAAWLDELRPTWYSAVPTIHDAVVALAGLDRAHAARIGLRFVRSSSAPLPPRLGAELEALFGAPVIEAYGMTEASHQVASNPLPPGDRCPGSVGRAAGAEVLIVDEAGRSLPPGARGEVAIRGAGVTTGYEGMVPARDAEGWLRTGDLGRLDADGYLRLVGRLKEMVNRGGEKIAPQEVEEALAAHPAVSEAVVFPTPHSTLGEDIGAAVVLRPGATATAQDLRTHVRARLADYKVPGQVRLVERIPTGPTGKVQRAHLAEQLGFAMAHLRGVTEQPQTPTEATLAGIWSDVLGVAVARGDDFFALGGDSLRAAIIAARAGAVLSVPVLASALFEAPTVAALGARLDATPPVAGLAVGPSPRQAGGPAPLSRAQQRLWLFETVEPGTAVYNEPTAWRLRGPLDDAALEHALADVVARHEALRTTFAGLDGNPVQRVMPPRPVALDRRDLSSVPERDRAVSVRELLEATAARPFDLAADLLLRVLLLRLGPQEHVFLLVVHHLAIDGWSRRVLIRDLGACYAARRAAASTPALAPLPLQPADLAIWERAQFDSETMTAARAYWRRQLEGAPPALELAADRPRPPRASHRGGVAVRLLPAELLDRLEALARDERATLFMVLFAGFAAMAHRYTGADDLVVGVPSAGRARPEAEAMVGFFVNTLPLRVDLSGDPTARALIARVRHTVLEAQAHEGLPFDQILNEARIARRPDRPPLVQVMFGYDSAGEASLDLGGLTVDPHPAYSGTAKFDLSVEARATATGLELTAVYNTDLFDADRMARLLEHVEVLLGGMVANPLKSLSSLPLMTASERQRVLVDENCSARPYAGPDTIHGLVEAQVARAPDAPAIVVGGETLTYREVNARANRLARHLRSVGVGPEQVVGVCLHRSPRLVVALLAVLKAGGAYVPLDPSLPAERIRLLLADSGARVALTEAALAERLGSDVERIIRVDDEPAPWAALPGGDLAPEGGPDTLAFILYTSGSTGRPKGVLCVHRAFVNYLACMLETFAWGPTDIMLPRTSIAFDSSIRELFGTLASGARMVLLDDRAARDPATLVAEAQAAGATVLTVVPSLLRAMAEVAEKSRGPITSLRLLHIGGEPLFGRDVRRARAHVAPRAQLVNHYGPTECAVNASYHVIRPGDESRAAVPLGIPVWNTTLYVLDSRGAPVPLGIPGEMWIGGVGVARGYRGAPELTAERFVPDPFDPTPGARMYRTGDVVCRRADGSLEMLGRADFQVKVRGNRVELEEVEAVIRRWPGVAEVVVTPWPAGTPDSDLAAYVVPTAGQRVEAAELRGHLRATLPGYMVPRYIDVLPALPRTPSRKVDRAALPAPSQDGRAVTDTYVAPRTRTEGEVAAIWEEQLETGPVGVHADFFDLGGHSLLALRVLARIHERLDVELEMRVLFDAPTVEALAAAIDAARSAAGSDADLARERDARSQR